MVLTLKQVSTFIKIIRYPNLLIMAATQVMCALFLTGEEYAFTFSLPFGFTLAATLLTAAGGYIINDIFDEAADVVNKPGKTYITTGNRNFYGLAYYSVTAAGIICGLLASLPVGIITLLMAALLYLYSYRLKKTAVWGNLAVALMSAAAILILIFVLPGNRGLYIIYAGFAFMTTLVREMVKDIEDTAGDRAAGYKTLPVVKGEKFAKTTTVWIALLLVALVLTWGVYCVLTLRLVAFYYIAALILLPSVGIVLFIRRANEKKQYAQVSLFCKLVMLAGIVSMLFVQ